MIEIRSVEVNRDSLDPFTFSPYQIKIFAESYDFKEINELRKEIERKRTFDVLLSENRIKKVIFNCPATIVLWMDGTKTVVKCQDVELYDKEKGLAMCIAKKALGNKGNYNNLFKKYIQ